MRTPGARQRGIGPESPLASTGWRGQHSAVYVGPHRTLASTRHDTVDRSRIPPERLLVERFRSNGPFLVAENGSMVGFRGQRCLPAFGNRSTSPFAEGSVRMRTGGVRGSCTLGPPRPCVPWRNAAAPESRATLTTRVTPAVRDTAECRGLSLRVSVGSVRMRTGVCPPATLPGGSRGLAGVRMRTPRTRRRGDADSCRTTCWVYPRTPPPQPRSPGSRGCSHANTPGLTAVPKPPLSALVRQRHRRNTGVSGPAGRDGVVVSSLSQTSVQPPVSGLVAPGLPRSITILFRGRVRMRTPLGDTSIANRAVIYGPPDDRCVHETLAVRQRRCVGCDLTYREGSTCRDEGERDRA